MHTAISTTGCQGRSVHWFRRKTLISLIGMIDSMDQLALLLYSTPASSKSVHFDARSTVLTIAE
jgi:hypothetical protein